MNLGLVRVWMRYAVKKQKPCPLSQHRVTQLKKSFYIKSYRENNFWKMEWQVITYHPICKT
jgi:hypothetical protein